MHNRTEHRFHPDSARLADRVRRLRLIHGFDQAELGKRLGVSSGTVSTLESGRLVPSSDVMKRLVETFRCSESYFVNPTEVGPLSRPWLRAYADASKRALDRQIADCTLAVEAIELLQLRTLPAIIPMYRGDVLDEDDIEQYALEVRAQIDLGPTEVVGNTIRACERLGCVVLPMREELGRHLGLSIRSGVAPIICVSRPSTGHVQGVPGDRQRFTVAHELGHVALHAMVGPPQTAEDAALIERQAHRFAGAFLAPGDGMSESLKEHGGRVTLRTLALIKGDWGISIKALVTRFRVLGVIDDDQARSLFKQISSRGWNTSEPVEVGNESAVWLTKSLARRARGDDPTQAAVAASGIHASHFQRWTDWSPTGAPAEIVSLAERRSRRTPPTASPRITSP
ncbi:MAG: XRE family transcriptional regulator [Actinomycetia bacterium]|nr:XRE family transcriptional regulator [Actinomycetes bacterium]